MNIHQAALQLLCSDSLSVGPVPFSSHETAVTQSWIRRKTLLINAPETSPVRVGWWETMDRRKLILCETSGHTVITVESMNNLPPHLKKVSLSKRICEAVNRRCICANKERSHCPSKVGVNRSIHGSVAYLAMWNGTRRYSHISRGICQLSGINTRYFDYRQLSKKTPNQKKTKTLILFSMRVSGSKLIFPFFYWTFPEEISYLTWQQRESTVNSLESK